MSVTTGTTERGAPPTGARSSGAPLERVTVNLVPRAAEALTEAAALTGDTKTDTINRALQVYALLERTVREGGAVYIRPAGGGELERVHFV